MSYRRQSHLSWRAIGEQTVIVDAKGKRLYGLNEAGGRVWHALDGEAGASELAARLSADTGMHAEDVARFLAELRANGLVEAAKDERQSSPEPPPSPEAPCVLWQEEIQTFARACSMLPGMNAVCNLNPRS